MANYQSFGDGYDGQGAGGFLVGGVTTSPASGSQGAGRAAAQRISTVTSATIFQLFQAESRQDDTFVINGREVSQVKIVGVVRQADVKSTKITYTVEDHTGTIEVVYWVNEGGEDQESRPQADIREGLFICVVGHIKTFGEKRQLTSFHIAPIKEADEITHHHLDALHTHLVLTRGSKQLTRGRADAPVSAAGAGPAVPVSRDYGGPAPMQASNGFDPLQTAIMTAIRGSHSDQGMSVLDLVSAMRGRYTEPQIRKAMEYLSQEGHLYSTIDDDHFCTTDS